MTKERLGFDVLLFALCLAGIAPLLLVIGALGAFRYRAFVEFLIAGFFYELLYGTGLWNWPLPFPVFLGAGVLFLCAKIIRSRLRS